MIMSDVDIKCFGNQEKINHAVITLYSREDIQDFKKYTKEKEAI